jgi:replicative DNA helicase
MTPPVENIHGLGGGRAEPVKAVVPHSLEAEQAVLGVLMGDNGAYERCGALAPSHFYEPLHGHLYGLIEAMIRKGQAAEPMSLTSMLENGPAAAAYEEIGGIRYLAVLFERAPPSAVVTTYAGQVLDAHKRREVIRVGGEMQADARAFDVDRPADAIIESAEAALYSVAEHATAQGGFVTFASALTGAVAMASEAFSRDGGLAGLATDLTDLDQKTGGLHPSDLIVLAARPSMGKTALATNIAFNVARKYAWEPRPDGTKKTVSGGVVGFFSLEMSAEQLAMRVLADASGVSGDRMRRGDIEAHEFGRIREAAIEIQEAPLYIDATGGISLPKLFARARRMKRQHGLDLVVVDYLQLVTIAGLENPVQRTTAVTMGLKALAKELGCPVVALSQLSRAVEQREDKRPMLSDLRESGSIEQDADMVWFVYREAYYVGRAEPREHSPEHLQWQEDMDRLRGRADLIISKQRHGPIGTIGLSFNEDTTRFGNLATSTFYGDRS